MTEQEWLTCTDPTPMLERLDEKFSFRKFRLFAVACCRRHFPDLVDQQCRDAVESAERFADGVETLHSLIEFRKKVNKLRRKLNNDGGVRRAAAAAAWLTSHENHAIEHVRFHVIQVKAWMQEVGGKGEAFAQVNLLHDIIGNPFRPFTINPAWLAWNDGTVFRIAQRIYDERAFDDMPILADALEDAGCDNEDILHHCRSDRPHVRGCWVVDLLLGKE